jgi:hypothetical protein
MSTEFVLKEGTFILNKVEPENKKKPNSPDFFGDAKFQGVIYHLSGWPGRSAAGNIKITGYIELKDDQVQDKPTDKELNDFLLTPQKVEPEPSVPGPLDTPIDDLPF